MSRPAQWPSGSTRLAAVIGDPVRHSLSPVLHNAAFAALDLDWVYLAFEVAAGDADGALAAARTLGIDGLSVTMPHKREVALHVDRLSPVASRLGAVNTVVRQGRLLVGDNTDGAGFLDALRLDEGFDPDGRRCVVLGAGGAARAVVVALADAGAAEVVVVARRPEAAAEVAALGGERCRPGEEAEASGADLVVNATPVGMAVPAPASPIRPGVDVDAAADPASIPLDVSLLGPGQLVADLVYHPPQTPLLHEARARGAAVSNGLGMLVHQAAHAFRLWTGHDAPLEAMAAAALRALTTSRDGSDRH